MTWKQPVENSIEGLRHAIENLDGIEFDLRLTKDNELIIHHDRIVATTKENLEGKPIYAEEWALDELMELGFASFDQLLADKVIMKNWIEGAKVVCLEAKVPHIKSKVMGKPWKFKSHDKYLGELLALLESKVDEAGVPKDNAVYYSFHSRMKKSADYAKIKRNWSMLSPNLPPYGGLLTEKIRGAPSFLTTSFFRLMRKHQKAGSKMMPCAIEYLDGRLKNLPLGYTVGLENNHLKRAREYLAGFPVYVWPCSLENEFKLLNGGFTGLTDNPDPNLTWLPSGSARWFRPSSLPLTSDQHDLLVSANEENHKDIVKQLKSEVTPWTELDRSGKVEILSHWRKKWSWEKTVDDLLASTSERSMPWESVRLIGHRGCGKTTRPLY